ncbi:MAG TPA: hypothetical protein VHN77_06535 [Phycisphaerales bacterium]|nr:hypothetical protein [Phycisphaerales bacterium]
MATTIRSFVLALGVVSAAATVGFAQPDVAIVAAAGSTATAVQFTDVQAKLMGTGEFASVTIINAGAVTPSLTELQAYDAVMTWSNLTYQSADGLGDVLADYVDAGGGVVVAVFATSTTTVNRSLGGRFRSGGYEIIVTQGGNTGGAASLGDVLVPTHPTMEGVTTFIGGTTASRPTNTNVTAHGYKVALWNDGKTLIAASTQYANRIDLGMYPPSRDALVSSWDPATDGARIMANALLATMGTPTPTCDSIDYNADGLFPDTQDIADFVSVFAGGSCSNDPNCGDIDFNNDGLFPDTLDIQALLSVFGGGECLL